MVINSILLFGLIFAALWTVMTVRLIRSIVGLALTSAILAVIMYRLNSPLAAVFELSVCSGLISVIFVTTVSFTQRISNEDLLTRRKERILKYWYLPVILIVAGLLLSRYLLVPQFNFLALEPAKELDVRNLLWNARHLDLLGQVVMLLAGALGVVVLFKEPKK
jgi:NADH-quinone oxidoreductase subunit J